MIEPAESESVSLRDKAAVCFAILLPSLVTWAYFFQAESLAAYLQQSVFATVKVLQFAFPLAWVAIMHRRERLWSLFRRPQSFSESIAWGGGFGLAVVVSAWALYVFWLRDSPVLTGAAAEEIRGKVIGMGLNSVGKYALLGVFYTICHSFLEEYYWRWFVYGELRRFLSIPTSNVISSLGFMAHHILVLGKYFGFDHPATWLFSIAVAVGGAFWAWLYERTGSLLGPWISHMLVDAAIFLIGFDLVREQLTGG